MAGIGSVAERLARNTYALDEGECHIEVNQDVARRTGTGKLLVRVCPAKVYGEAADGTITVAYAGCLECGTCLVVAAPGALTWHYPRGGFGIAYREG
jgi:ferredoxin like protein